MRRVEIICGLYKGKQAWFHQRVMDDDNLRAVLEFDDGVIRLVWYTEIRFLDTPEPTPEPTDMVTAANHIRNACRAKNRCLDCPLYEVDWDNCMVNYPREWDLPEEE